MKSLNKRSVMQKYHDIIASTGVEEDILHLTKMLSFRFLSEVEKLCEERNINKKELSKIIGVSQSYITQLYRGSSKLNLDTIGKFEYHFGVRFDVNCVDASVIEIGGNLESSWDERQINLFVNKFKCDKGMWLYKKFNKYQAIEEEISKSINFTNSQYSHTA